MDHPSGTAYPEPARLLDAARALPPARVSSFVLDGQVFWVKRPETLPPRMRFQKGDSAASFGRELALLRGFSQRGAPVPPVLVDDTGLVVMPDMGEPLAGLVLRVEPAQAATVLAQAAHGLATMHRTGLVHGRPSLRDLCWNGAQVTFLDLEAGARIDAGEWRQARDLVLLLHSVMRIAPDKTPLVQATLDGYRQHGAASVIGKARRFARVLAPVLVPFARFAPPPKGKLGEVAALLHLVLFLR
ncbi:MAG: hypothetical protein GVY34_10030 [Alphaproteobacteria bacterium]|jgi:tRNA A-37 threonylcarbamoyl transferase component Bud32|nr:hypothetical protein [Alphaproteobacteria bacterium]